MSSIHFWRWATLTSILASATLIAAIVSLGLVQSADTQTGGAVTQVKTVSSSAEALINSETLVNLPGAFANVTVPAGEEALIVARFTAEARCLTPEVSAVCLLGILIDGKLLSPGEAVFDEASATHGLRFMASHEASLVVGPGTHQVRVKWRVDEANTDFSMFSWHLTVMRSRK
ncbi:MAG: hypothetical protein WEB00_09840 [Dehalococcoidia bacterium]